MNQDPNIEKDIFAEALELPPDQREVFLKGACRSDEQLRQRVEDLLRVHEAYLRLIGQAEPQWQNSRHFFSAAAEAMRRILVERARHKARQKYGGDWQRVDLDEINVATESNAETLLFVSDALEKLAVKDPVCAELIKLRFFAGIPNHQAAQMLGLSERTAKRNWAYARAWLAKEIEQTRDR